MNNDILKELVDIIRERRSASAETSYTKTLLEAGSEKCAKKLGEEAVETVIAAVSQDDEALRAEAADLLYHLLVVLECRNIALHEVLDILGQRMGMSGLEEKASRERS